MKSTRIIVWLDENEYWSRVFIQNGKLFVKCEKRTYRPIEECNVREIDTL